MRDEKEMRTGRRIAPSLPRNYYARGARRRGVARAIDEAVDVVGLDDEIAALRVRLREMLNEEEPDMPAVLKALEVLTKAVAAQYRMSPRSKKELSDNLAAVLNSFGDLILPPGR